MSRDPERMSARKHLDGLTAIGAYTNTHLCGKLDEDCKQI